MECIEEAIEKSPRHGDLTMLGASLSLFALQVFLPRFSTASVRYMIWNAYSASLIGVEKEKIRWSLHERHGPRSLISS
jgi:hypothetical protein